MTDWTKIPDDEKKEYDDEEENDIIDYEDDKVDMRFELKKEGSIWWKFDSDLNSFIFEFENGNTYEVEISAIEKFIAGIGRKLPSNE